LNTERVEWTVVWGEEIAELAPFAQMFHAIYKANKPQGRYPSQAVDGGSRSTDSTSSVERAVLRPDIEDARLDAYATDIALAREALDRCRGHARFFTNRAEREPRVNSVTACKVCGGPCMPKVFNYPALSEGPFDEKCYRSLARFMEANPRGTYGLWLKNRVDKVDAA
jgi:hypothetical protein